MNLPAGSEILKVEVAEVPVPVSPLLSKLE